MFISTLYLLYTILNNFILQFATFLRIFIVQKKKKKKKKNYYYSKI